MSNAKTRLATTSQTLNVELTPDALGAMASFLVRLEKNMAWPDWDEVQTTADSSRSLDGTKADIKVIPLVEAALAKARLSAEGGAYLTIDAAGARAAAQAIDASPRLGSLAGLTIAVKDLLAVAGQPLSAASAVRQEAPVSAHDAPVVAALRGAGAVIIGTTSLHEFAFGVTGINDHAGTPANPYDAGRVPGGSSSGSAVAVAEGSAAVAIGTDTGGSVRIPAALCGVVGFKPAFGTYPIEGVFPLAPTLDHVGFLARSVADIQQVHNLFAPPVSGDRRPVQVGVVRAELERCDEAVQERFETVVRRLEQQGCEVVGIDPMWPSSEEVFTISTTIMFSEAAAIHKGNLHRNANRYGPDVRNRLLQGLTIPAADYVTALQARQSLKQRVQSALATVDCVLGPTIGIVAPTIEAARDPAVSAQLVAFTRLGNVSGLPALSLPIPGEGLPVGLQIFAEENERVLQLAGFFEALLVE